MRVEREGKIMKKVWKVVATEYERGWGQRPWDTRYFSTEEKAWDYTKSINEQNTAPTAPDWYVSATSPQAIDIPDEVDIDLYIMVNST
jgi:hypothetical protein